jgi:hypothetical protein
MVFMLLLSQENKMKNELKPEQTNKAKKIIKSSALMGLLLASNVSLAQMCPDFDKTAKFMKPELIESGARLELRSNGLCSNNGCGNNGVC